jgi:hypothetical protein
MKIERRFGATKTSIGIEHADGDLPSACQNYRSSINLFSVGTSAPRSATIRGIVRGRLQGLRPLDGVHGLAIALTRGRPERSESRDDDFLGENIGEIVGLFETFVSEP